MPSVLFVCTGNLFRSPIAEACFRRYLQRSGAPKEWVTGSAGTWTRTGVAPDPRTVLEAQRLGLDIRAHRSRLINAELLSRYDLVLVMEAGQKEALQVEFPHLHDRVFLLSEVVDGISYDIPDPAEAGHTGTEENIPRELVGMIGRGYNKICMLAVKISRSGN
jgi:protein-tyrosine phosphatase